MLGPEEVLIDDEFQALCRPLSEDERVELLKSIERDGFRDPLVVWLGYNLLLDGHNRYDIWQTLYQSDRNREPPVVQVRLKDRAEAIRWIIRNQLGRRNLEPFERAELALKLEPVISAEAKANQRRSPGRGKKGSTNSSNLSEPPSKPNKRNTRAELADLAGVSEDTISKAKTISEQADEQTKADLRSGKVSLNAAHRQLTGAAPNSANGNKPPAPTASPPMPAQPPAPSPADRLAREAIDCLKRIARDDPARGPALARVADWLQQHAQQPADNFAARFDAAFARLDRESGGNNFIKLHALRLALPEFTREQFDSGLRSLRGDGGRYVLDSSDGNVVSLTTEEKAAGIQEAGSLLVYCSRR